MNLDMLLGRRAEYLSNPSSLSEKGNTVNTPKIAILGAGPSAAFAFRACRDKKIMPDVFANRITAPFGAFWLYRLPPSITKKQRQAIRVNLHTARVGTASGYALKMWGDPILITSFPAMERNEFVYHPRKGLQLLWQGVKLTHTRRMTDSDVRSLAQRYDLVFQTFPTERSRRLPNRVVPFETYTQFSSTDSDFGLCLYNGLPESEWARVTYAFGRVSFEYPPDPNISTNKRMQREYRKGNWIVQVVNDIVPDVKPIAESPAPNVFLIGRYATWNRKELAHEAYEKVLGIVTSLEDGE